MKVLGSITGSNVEAVRQLIGTVNALSGVHALELSLSTPEGEISPMVVAPGGKERHVAVCRDGLTGRESRALQMLFSALEALCNVKLVLQWGDKQKRWIIIHEK